MITEIFDELEIRSAKLFLKLPTQAELNSLAQRALGNILSENQKSFFANNWAQLPSPEFEEGFLGRHNSLRTNFQIDKWIVALGIHTHGQPYSCVGVVTIQTQNFTHNLRAETASWVLKTQQGKGIGYKARRLSLEFIFRALRAKEAVSGAHADNAASNKISLKLGYRLVGQNKEQMAHEQALINHYLLPTQEWSLQDDVHISGFDKAPSRLGMNTETGDSNT